jgi:serine/threonine protein kinase
VSSGGPVARQGSEVVAGYRVVRLLSRGNILDVYDAWSEERSCRCVVKTLRPDRLDDWSARGALLREGRLLSALTHPHLVRAYDVVDASRPAIVLETLTGETLSYLVDRRSRRLGAAELGILGLQLVSALGYLHRNGFLHLDLKPSNVVAEAGRAKIIDLSIAQPPGPIRPDVGTWCYLAPEQALGGSVGSAADVWGLGATLWEAAIGRAPFDDGDDGPEYPQLVRRAEPLRRLRPRLPHAVTATIDACLDPDPRLRPRLDDVAEVLGRVLGVPDLATVI